MKKERHCQHDSHELYKGSFIACYCMAIKAGRTIPVIADKWDKNNCPLKRDKPENA